MLRVKSTSHLVRVVGICIQCNVKCLSTATLFQAIHVDTWKITYLLTKLSENLDETPSPILYYTQQGMADSEYRSFREDSFSLAHSGGKSFDWTPTRNQYTFKLLTVTTHYVHNNSGTVAHCT